MSIRLLSLLLFAIPTSTVIFSYILSLYLNLVPSCLPILDGCTSISRTGRYYPVNYFFKTFMFLTGFCLFIYWYKNNTFIVSNFNTKLIKPAYILGIFSVLFLFLYIFFLGESNYYKFFRKIGIFIYILFSVIAELILSIIFYKNKFSKFFATPSVIIKLILSSFLTIIGIFLFPFMIMKIDNVANIRNIISWNFFLLIQLNFLLTFFVFKKN